MRAPVPLDVHSLSADSPVAVPQDSQSASANPFINVQIRSDSPQKAVRNGGAAFIGLNGFAPIYPRPRPRAHNGAIPLAGRDHDE